MNDNKTDIDISGDDVWMKLLRSLMGAVDNSDSDNPLQN